MNTRTDLFASRSPRARARLAFFHAVEADLQRRCVPLDAAELLAWACAVWPLVEPGDTPGRWATAFLVALQGA